MQFVVDYEFNSQKFWNAFYELFPSISQEVIHFSQEDWEVIKTLPGFDDGPEWAPHPFVRVED